MTPSTPILIHGTHSDLVAFLFLSIWPSHFGLPLLLIIILSSKTIQRHPTFISMCVTWIITGLSSSILYVSIHISISPSHSLSTDYTLVKQQVQNHQKCSVSYRLPSYTVYLQWFLSALSF